MLTCASLSGPGLCSLPRLYGTLSELRPAPVQQPGLHRFCPASSRYPGSTSLSGPLPPITYPRAWAPWRITHTGTTSGPPLSDGLMSWRITVLSFGSPELWPEMFFMSSSKDLASVALRGGQLDKAFLYRFSLFLFSLPCSLRSPSQINTYLRLSISEVEHLFICSRALCVCV